MAAPKIVSGARAKVSIVTGSGSDIKANFIGIFNNVSYSVQYGAQPVYILGRFSPAEIDYTHAEPVQVSLGAWRAIGGGPYESGQVTKLQDLLTHEGCTLHVMDRVNDDVIATITGLRPTGYNHAITARQLTEYTVTAIGTLIDDESTQNSEAAGSMDLP